MWLFEFGWFTINSLGECEATYQTHMESMLYLMNYMKSDFNNEYDNEAMVKEEIMKNVQELIKIQHLQGTDFVRIVTGE